MGRGCESGISRGSLLVSTRAADSPTRHKSTVVPMARQAEKQLAKNNVAKIALLRNLAIGVNAIFVLVRLVWCFRSTTKKTWFFYIITNIIACMIHTQLSTMGSPKYAADGSLKSSGEDLAQSGLTEYLTDIVYVTWIIYVLVALITDYAWLLYLAASASPPARQRTADPLRSLHSQYSKGTRSSSQCWHRRKDRHR